MATVSTRLDDDLKTQAETVADLIGIPLSTAINVFLKKFVATNGFPFDVVAPSSNSSRSPIIDTAVLDAAVKRAVADTKNTGRPEQFTYLDTNTDQLTTIKTKE